MLPLLSSPVPASATSKHGEEDECTDDRSDGDYDVFVVIDPGFDFATERGATALTLLKTLLALRF